jgi:hypothetical protein
MVYISRYFIHEILFVFFSLALVVAILFFSRAAQSRTFRRRVDDLAPARLFSAFGAQSGDIHRSKPNRQCGLSRWRFFCRSALVFFRSPNALEWDAGRPIYLICVGVRRSAFRHQGTAFITLGTMAIAVLRLAVAQNLRRGVGEPKPTSSKRRI